MQETTTSQIIVFSDIKDFTLKTSLLTSKQIDEILSEHEKLVVPAVHLFEGKILKTLGDAYMITFKTTEKALKCAMEIQKRCCEFNKDKKLNLYKIELRIAINKGEVISKTTSQGDDIFGGAVNMSHRLETITPENKIFVTSEVYDEAQVLGGFVFHSHGKTTFKGILHEVEIYELLVKDSDIEAEKNGKLARLDLNKGYTSEYSAKVKEADDVIFTASSVGALLGVQPIPFLDTFNLVPIHAYMLIRIANIYGVHMSVGESLELSKKMIATIGLSYLAMQGAIGASKFLLPLIAGYATMPINFSITYGMGKMFSSYYYHHVYGVAFSNGDMKDLFVDKRLGGKEMGKLRKDEIIKRAKESKDMIMNSDIIKDIMQNLTGGKKEPLSQSNS